MFAKDEIRITIIYLIVGLSWIIFSDRLVNSLPFNQLVINRLQTFKGFIYVLFTALIFYYLIHNALEKLRNKKQEVKQKNQQLQHKYEEVKILNEQLEDTHDKLAVANAELSENKKKYQSIYNNAPLGIIIWDKNYNIIGWNSYAQKIFGWEREEIIGENLVEILVPSSEFDETTVVENGILKDINTRNISKNLTKSGKTIVCEWNNEPIYDNDGDIKQVISIAKNITKEKELEKQLREKEKMYRTLFENTGTATLILDEDSKIELVNEKVEEISNYSKEDLIGKEYKDFVANDKDLKRVMNYNKLRKLGKTDDVPDKYEVQIKDKQGGVMDVLTQANLIPGTKKTIVSIIDITKSKQIEKKIRYISYHDCLTGLYNRKYYEEELKRLDTSRQLPLSIIIGDLNRLKMANDIFGHEAGDELLKMTAEILQMSTREEDVIARWGGDEFGIILPQTNEETAKEVIKRIKLNCKNAEIKFITLQIALGCATRVAPEQRIKDVFKKAEDRMYEDKQKQKENSDEYLLKKLMSKLKVTDNEIIGHTTQIVQLAEKLGKKLNLSDHEVKQLSLLAKFHDFGKIAISNEILYEKNDLDKKEWDEFKKHTEVGYDIAKNFETLRPIANYILHHHEQWNGQGYPRGIKNEEIPLLSRAIHIIDLFDALTNDIYYPISPTKYYKEVMSPVKAIKEIKSYSGTLFDPEIVEIFVEMVEDE